MANSIAMLRACGQHQWGQEGAAVRVVLPTVSGEPAPYTGDQPSVPEEPMGHPEAVPLRGEGGSA